MNTVEPIRDYDLLMDISDFYKETGNQRNYVLWMFGIYAPLRISDILRFRVRDVRGKSSFHIREKKTGKEQTIAINDDLKKILADYIKDKPDREYLFHAPDLDTKPLSRQQAYNIMNYAAKKFKLEKIGCHTMRKTFGYHYYRQTGDIMILQKIFNHNHPNVTLLYIGITQDTKNKAIKDFRYKRL